MVVLFDCLVNNRMEKGLEKGTDKRVKKGM